MRNICFHAAAWHNKTKGMNKLNTYSFAMGMEPRRFGLTIMLAWLRKLMLIFEGRRRHGSPSTCMGIDLKVLTRTSRHWVNRSPWPPTWRVACRLDKGTDLLCLLISVLWTYQYKQKYDNWMLKTVNCNSWIIQGSNFKIKTVKEYMILNDLNILTLCLVLPQFTTLSNREINKNKRLFKYLILQKDKKIKTRPQFFFFTSASHSFIS